MIRLTLVALMLFALARPVLADLPQDRKAQDARTALLVARADSLIALGIEHVKGRRPAAAEAVLAQALELHEDSLASRHPDLERVLVATDWVLSLQGRAVDRQANSEHLLELQQQRLGPDHFETIETQIDLAHQYESRGDLQGAAAMFEAILTRLERLRGADYLVASALDGLGRTRYYQARYGDAERITKRTLSVAEEVFGPEHYLTLFSVRLLGWTHLRQGRYADAETLLRRALNTERGEPERERDNAVLAKLSRRYATAFGEIFDVSAQCISCIKAALVEVYANDGRIHEARAEALDALRLAEASGDSLWVSTQLRFLVQAYMWQGRYADAEQAARRGLAILRQHPEQNRLLAFFLIVDATMHVRAHEAEEALALLAEAEALGVVDNLEGGFQTQFFATRAEAYKQLGRLDDALEDLQHALDVVEEMRPFAGGAEQTRAAFLENYTDMFDRMVAWQLEAGDTATAFEYAERGRARVLQDQLRAGQIDIRSSIPSDLREPLEARETEVLVRLAELQHAVTRMRARRDLPDAERERNVATLEDSIRTAQAAYSQLYEEIKSASPLWQSQITAGGRPLELRLVQRRLVPDDGLMLLYQIGPEQSFVFVIPPSRQTVQAMPLVVSDTANSMLGIDTGPLSHTSVSAILGTGTDDDSTSTGLLAQLVSPTRSKVTGRAGAAGSLAQLHALWQVLVPEALRKRLRTVEQLVLIPDGALAGLPFEALVTRLPTASNDAEYWLDAGPAIRYTPSATVLYSLEDRPPTRLLASADRPLLVTLSDPIYDPGEAVTAMAQGKPAAETFVSADDGLAAVTRDAYVRAGGSLARLPGTARESQEIVAQFSLGALGRPVVRLSQLDATESKLRDALPGSRYVHLATHGLVDEADGALFAALATTPPTSAEVTSANDGYLQLYEIYDLPLDESELAVLSACETNVGTSVEGEGVFALSRGFLAAGTRRVIASQWAVDDASTAVLIGTVFKSIAEAERAGTVADFTIALRDAKRRIRSEERWSDPFYWAPFILIGAR